MGAIVVTRIVRVAAIDAHALQQVVDKPRLNPRCLAARLALGRPALQQSSQAGTFFDEGTEKTLMACQA
ncbi:hypothetical protein D3C80_2189180 [compost metagenome]